MREPCRVRGQLQWLPTLQPWLCHAVLCICLMPRIEDRRVAKQKRRLSEV